MTQKFSDVARAELAADINDVATSFTITSGGSLFPVADTGSSAIGPGADWFKVTLVDDDGYETVYVRTHTAGSTTFSNVLRGQEGTTARAFNAVHAVSGNRTVVGLRVSAADYDRFEAKEPPITAGTTAQYWRGDKTWRDLATDVRAAVLTGLSTATNAAVTATDTVLQAIGKLQKQVTDHLAATNNPHGVTKSQVGLGNVDNVSAANLRDRSTHTGTQAASTITGLATVATSGSYNDLGDKPSIPTLPATVGQAEAEAGAATTVRGWTSQRVRQNVAAYTYSKGETNALISDLASTTRDWQATTASLTINVSNKVDFSSIRTLTLPSSPAENDFVEILRTAGNTTGSVIARNGKTIEDLAENLNFDANIPYLRLDFVNNSWRVAS